MPCILTSIRAHILWELQSDISDIILRFVVIFVKEISAEIIK